MCASGQLSRTALETASICTLFEGDYHCGLAALVNSLVVAGYAGTVWVGYRGPLPPWLGQLERLSVSDCTYRVAGKIRLVFLAIDTAIHFTNYKPQFMLDLFAGPAFESAYLWYFDPDIFVRCHWSFFTEWQQHGIALCQEIINNILPSDSPLRHQWMRTAEAIGFKNPRPLDHYFSGGMVGVSASHRSFLESWQRILERAEEEGCDRTVFRVKGWGRVMPFMASDQDALNVAAMYSEHPLSTMGPEAMGFSPSGFTMYHAVGPKPWRTPFLRSALAGIPPNESDKFFLTHVSSPICVYSKSRLCAKRIACSVAAFIGRFYRRR